ncbi:MAG: CFI-box-CTERM domain-containing protein [Syntrophales bacterium]
MNWRERYAANCRKLTGLRQWMAGKKYVPLPAALIVCTALGVIVGAGGISAQSPVFKLTGLEVNQVLGVQKDNHQYYVAGKNTVIRVFLDPAVEIEAADTWVNVSRDGNVVFKLHPKKTDDAVPTVDFLCTNSAACQNWTAGSYTFQATINGTQGGISNPHVFSTGTVIRVLAVAVKANYGTGGIKSVSGTRWKKMGEFMQNVYPLAEGNLVWKIHPTVLDAAGDQYDLQKSKGEGDEDLARALANLIPARCKTSPQGTGCYDFVVGFIKEPLTQDNGKTLAGYVYPGTKAVVAVASDDDAPGTVAHELAHQYGIGDTYDDKDLSSIRCTVNPAPDGFKGLDWDTRKPVSCAAGRPASTLKGEDGKTIINGAQVAVSDHPYEVNGRGDLEEMADFMSEGGASQEQLWITKDNYDWLYRRLVKQEPGLKHPAVMPAASGAAQRFISFSGTLPQTDAVTVDPWKSYTDTATLADSTGSLMVQAVNGIGSVVASTAFTVQFFMVHPLRELTVAPFAGVVNFPAGTETFRIVKDGRVLAEVAVSANEPAVGGVTPRTTTTLSGPYTITWTGNDPDGDRLTYMVEYNPDVTDPASAWMILAADLETSSWTEDFSQLPGGSHARIRVTAYDGTLYAEAESAEFIVPLKQPEVFLDELPWGTDYQPGADILLTAEAFDPQDGWLPDDNIRWTSNISGELGYGSELLVRNLAAGRHRITVTATNSAGLSSGDTVEVQVGSSGSTKCFIATAAFGSILHPAVGLLRDFRDAYLLTSGVGRAFVAWYYRVSPPLAAAIAPRAYARAIVRIVLLPAVGFSALALQIGFFWSVMLILAVLLAAGMGARNVLRRT